MMIGSLAGYGCLGDSGSLQHFGCLRLFGALSFPGCLWGLGSLLGTAGEIPYTGSLFMNGGLVDCRLALRLWASP